jgi:hypothetical protein
MNLLAAVCVLGDMALLRNIPGISWTSAAMLLAVLGAMRSQAAHASCGDWLAGSHETSSLADRLPLHSADLPMRAPCNAPHCREVPAVPVPVPARPQFEQPDRLGVIFRELAAPAPAGRWFQLIDESIPVPALRGRIDRPPRF